MANEQLQRAVKEALMWDPMVDHSAIAVSADDNGVVTLEGTVGSPRHRDEAGRDARGVYGVREVKNELAVRILLGDRVNDADVRGAVLQALRLNSLVPPTVDARVDHGVVTLTGKAQWHFERSEAEFVAGSVRGVRSVRSEIVLEPTPSEADLEQGIRAELQRIAAIDGASVYVDSANGTVTLKGHVSSWAARDAAVAAAWKAPGVTKVEDHIAIDYSMLY